MSLPARQRRMLDRIEIALRGSDPKLAALYAIFARLNRDEEMPRVEQLRHSAVILLARVRGGLRTFFGRLRFRIVPRQRAVLFLPLALLLAIVSIVYAARSSSGDTCASVRQTASSSPAPVNPGARTRLCQPASPYSMYAGATGH